MDQRLIGWMECQPNGHNITVAIQFTRDSRAWTALMSNEIQRVVVGLWRGSPVDHFINANYLNFKERINSGKLGFEGSGRGIKESRKEKEDYRKDVSVRICQDKEKN